MTGVLDRNTFCIIVRRGPFSIAKDYDVLDPATNQRIGIVQEVPHFGRFFKWLRWDSVPFTLNVLDTNRQKVLTVKCPIPLFRCVLTIQDSSGVKLGSYRSKMGDVSGFIYSELLDRSGKSFALLQGNFLSRKFSIITSDGKQLALIQAKWEGIRKELGKGLFGGTDVYLANIDPSIADENLKKLVLAGAFCVDALLGLGGGGA